MVIVCVILLVVVIILTVRLSFVHKEIKSTVSQLREIEARPETNRQIKAIAAETGLEELLSGINDIYRARQQERILYQRRETQIRREIENISHDLRTPLTSIIGYVDLIRDEGELNPKQEEYLDIIQKRARVLQGFIKDFYELSRIEGDSYPILLDRIPVQSLLMEAAVAYYNEFEKKSIHVEPELLEEECYIIADRIQLNRIFNNLIQNALKYTKHHFIIKHFIEGQDCVLQFINDADHINENELKLIFDRFYTGDLSRSNGSTGLGLTITKLLVERMKGIIEAKLEKDMFVIELRFKVSI